MARGRIDIPNLDDRTWQDLVAQAKALVPKYAPEWTDLGPSDPGITLIELFAWLVEGMIYRLNRVPEKNYIAFLNLLGITRSPATPATTWLTYTCSQPVILPKGTQAATQQTESRPAVVFETDQSLIVLPANLVAVRFSNDSKDSTTTNWDELSPKVVSQAQSGRRLPGWTDKLSKDKSVYWLLGFDATAGGDRYKVHFEIPEPKWSGTATVELYYTSKGGTEANSSRRHGRMTPTASVVAAQSRLIHRRPGRLWHARTVHKVTPIVTRRDTG